MLIIPQLQAPYGRRDWCVLHSPSHERLSQCANVRLFDWTQRSVTDRQPFQDRGAAQIALWRATKVTHSGN
jgi:hypothetical protein